MAEFEFNQLLHGYQDGHRLLASSCNLLPEVDRFVSIVSDMSGPSMVKGFERYLTGYPIPQEEKYALAMTWYAPEMKRPGCVYTHTILIRYQDLPYIQSYNKILNLFNKPNAKNNYSEYKDFICYIDESINCTQYFDSPNNHEYHRLQSLLLSVYMYPTKPVICSSIKSDDWEQVFLMLWSQQWPRLRRSFSFCSGSLSFRRITGKSFDLQNIPSLLAPQILREAPQATTVESIVETGNDNLSPILDFLVRDCINPNHDFRSFLKKHGIHIENGRSAFLLFAKIYIELQSKDNNIANIIDNIISLINDEFPSVNTNRAFKKTFFSTSGTLAKAYTEEDSFPLLVLSKSNKCLPPKALKIKDRAKAFYIHQKDASLNLLRNVLTKQLTPVQRDYVAGIFEAISESDAIEFSRDFRGILPTIVTYNERLLHSEEIWNAPGISPRELLLEVQKFPEVSIDILLTILKSGVSDEIATDLISIYGSRCISTALDWQNANQSFLGWGWGKVFRQHTNEVLDWIQVHDISISTLIFFATYLDPNDLVSCNLDPQYWKNLSNRLYEVPSGAIRRQIISFLFSYAYIRSNIDAAEIIANVFQEYHDIVATNYADFDGWNLIRNELPYLGVIEWDKCEKIRRGLVKKFVETGWPYHLFIKSVSSPDTLERIIEYCLSSKATRKFLKKIKNGINNGSISVTPEQRNLFNQFYLSLKLLMT